MKRFRISLILLGTVLFFTGCGYNTMQTYEEDVFKAWGNLESQLQRRADLIPNLVATVKGSAQHESKTLTQVVEARAKATQVKIEAKDLSEKSTMNAYRQAQDELGSSISRLLVSVENYPNLRANENFKDLQSQLEGTENRISVARQRYNNAVNTFNSSIRRFPNSITNKMFLHLDRKEYYQASEAAKQVPKVNF